MDFDLQNASAGLALTAGTLLHDRYRILTPLSMDDKSITYEAADGADNARVCVREYCPMDIAARVETSLTVDEEQAAAFAKGLRTFAETGKILRRGLPHISPVTAMFQSNGTAYITSDMPGGTTLSELKIRTTFTYIQSLGIALCDSFAALHEAGLYYGMLREEHLRFSATGAMTLSSEPIRPDGSVQEDLTGLISFLKVMLPTDGRNDPAEETVKTALAVSHPDAESLRRALMGIGGSPDGKVRTSRAGLLGLLICLFFLSASIFAISRIPEPEPELAVNVETGKVDPQVISVWMPIPDNADEKELVAMYDRLTDGFEREHPGCGIKLRIYADDTFPEALAKLDEVEEQPAVFMDTQDPIAAEHAAGLTALTYALQDVYAADMTQFETFVPLACSAPVLLYNEHRTPELDEDKAIRFDDLPSNTLYDVSAAEFISAQGAKQQPAEQLEGFLNDGHNPVLASSSCITEAEHTGISAGAVHMRPVETSDGVPLQYEMYCSINANADPGARRVGMLWLQYLLTEEAQQILFVEHYSDLPLHKKALQSAAEKHRELDVVTKAVAAGKGD